MVHRVSESWSAAVLALGLFTTGCGPMQRKTHKAPQRSSENIVTNSAPQVDRSIGDADLSVQVLGSATISTGLQDHSLISPTSSEGRAALKSLSSTSSLALADDVPGAQKAAPNSLNEDSLHIGFPKKLLGQGMLFGGVITKISDRDSEALGGLKLTDLPAMNVRPQLVKKDDGDYLTLVGCASQCTELSKQESLFAFPVHALSVDGNMLIIDLAAIVKDLNLLGILDPEGKATGYKSQNAKATFVDYASSTLVFDIVSELVAVEPDPAQPTPASVSLTSRWYLKLEAGLNSSFADRLPTKGVGYFGTSATAEEKVTRHALTQFGDERPIVYYAKDVPLEQQPHFAASFDQWNEVFRELLGRDVIQYEFVTSDPTDQQLVTGDVRYNVLEWDLNNRASYGGLGPSIASQTSGQIFSSNVLVQGPLIVARYRKWFEVIAAAETLRTNGDEAAAQALERNFHRETKALGAATSRLASASVTLGKHQLQIPAQKAALEDPAFPRMDFYDTPEGQTYESYMKGYWQELVTHELGHNLGLRHNFRGNLLADGVGEVQSSSVMEYLSRPYRFKNKIGIYDKMAIAYGYTGKLPERLDLFCTDENVPSEDDDSSRKLSAECSRDDATADPFTMFEAHLRRALDLGVGRSTPSAPTWTAEDLKADVAKAVAGMSYYASSASDFVGSWTNWQLAQESRPTDAALVPAYVATSLKAKLCDPSLDVVVRSKTSPEAQAATLANLTALRAEAYTVTDKFGLTEAVRCP